MEIPETRYTKTEDGVHIAYQVMGEGPIDFVYAAPWVTHLEYRWELPEYATYLRRIASFTRLILFDRRGLGLSDPIDPEHLPDLETRMVDLGAVMDAVGSDRAVVYGASESGSLATLFAASHPERTSALVLHGSFPSGSWEPDAPWGYTKEYFAERLDMIDRAWGTEEYVRWEFPTFTDERLIRWVASYLRRSASPGAVLAWDRMDYETDVRDVLGAIHVPTLILHREEDAPEANRYLAEHIPGAHHVALPGREHVPYVGDQDAVLRQIEAFVRSIRDEAAELDRVLATVLFTDIVDSTAQAAKVGDVAWTKIRADHDAIVRAQLARYRGREIKTMGDGFLATFDGPARGALCGSDRERRPNARDRDPGRRAHRGGCHRRGRHRGARRRDRRAGRRESRRIRGPRLPDREGPRRRQRPHVRERRRARTEGRARPLASLSGGGLTLAGDPLHPAIQAGYFDNSLDSFPALPAITTLSFCSYFRSAPSAARAASSARPARRSTSARSISTSPCRFKKSVASTSRVASRANPCASSNLPWRARSLLLMARQVTCAHAQYGGEFCSIISASLATSSSRPSSYASFARGHDSMT